MHIVVRSEAHDSGLCAAPPERKREFARDIRNLTLLALHLNRNLKGAKDAADWTLDENRCWFAATTNASAASLMPFVEESVEPGSVVHTDGWLGYEPLEKKGYQHRIVFLSGRRKQASELLPRVHQAISLLKRWLLGTHQGAVSHEHLDYYLDEFVFRFNRRSSRSRGKLFYRLVQQAVAVDPTPYRSIVADWDADATPCFGGNRDAGKED